MPLSLQVACGSIASLSSYSHIVELMKLSLLRIPQLKFALYLGAALFFVGHLSHSLILKRTIVAIGGGVLLMLFGWQLTANRDPKRERYRSMPWAALACMIIETWDSVAWGSSGTFHPVLLDPLFVWAMLWTILTIFVSHIYFSKFLPPIPELSSEDNKRID
jgi:hypothetical protein